jgi:N-acetylmuramoyl-L-alanine amidase
VSGCSGRAAGHIRPRSIILLLFSIVLIAVGQLSLRLVLPAGASTLPLNIVYPGEGDKLPYVRKSFIFGSTAPGSTVGVNGVAALVAPSGGWIAYVPFAPGEFRLHVVARNGGATSSEDRVVSVAAPPRTLPVAPARIDTSIIPAPREDMTLNPGDTVDLFIKASTGARVTASFDGGTTRVPMVETRAPSLSPTEKERILGDAIASGDSVGGLYKGEFRVPAAPGTLSVEYTVTAPDGSVARASAKGSISVAPAGSFKVGHVVLADRTKDIDARPYGIVESEPEGGWLFFPPEHTPFEVTGGAGNYYRVALGANQTGWIDKRSIELEAPGTSRPHASVQGIVVEDGARDGSIIVHLSSRVPYWVTESADPPGLRIRLFGAVAGGDFVRYGEDRGNVAEVHWDQLGGEVATLEIKLRQRTMWGYHAGWDGNDLKLVVKKPPHFKSAPASALGGLLVVIDPGHSPDSGSIGPLGTQERDVNLAIAKRLAVHLENLGARTALTRTANVPVGLYDRTDLAANARADILISVHNNALPDGVDPFTHHGFSVYYYQPQSLGLARAIHNAYRRDLQLPDYGLYYDNLALTRPTEEPAVLTESAFIMWPPEEMDLRSPAFQDKLATTIVDGMNRWAGAMRALELRK